MHTDVTVSVIRNLVVLGLLGTLACSRKSPEPVKETTPVASAKVTPSYRGDGQLDPNDPKHGTRKLMGLDAPVYVDGAQVAVLRYGELPPIRALTTETGNERFRLYDYLKGIGIAPETVKSVHLHGNQDRIGSIEGTELLKEKDRFVFSFVSAGAGAPLQRWSGTGLKNEFVVHELRRVTVYVKKPSPPIDPQKQCHVGPDNECSDAIPYANGDVAKGTRVYVDGKMVGYVKRRQVADAMLVGPAMPDSSDNHYGLAKLVAGLGVDPASIKTTELTAGDDVVARATGAELLAPELFFTLPKHNHGKVRMHIPGGLNADRDGLVSAVLLYKNTTPKDHELVAISEETDTSVLVATTEARGREGQNRGEN